MDLAIDRQATERAPVALGQPAVRDRGLDVGVEIEEAEGVRDRRPRLADALRDVLLGEPELLDELAVGQRLVDRVEVGALHVLDEGDLELRPVGELANEGRDALQADQARGPHAALAGDELVAVEGLGDEHRLEHAVLADACRELLEHRVVDPVARLVRVRGDARERHLHDRRRSRSGAAGSARTGRGRAPRRSDRS